MPSKSQSTLEDIRENIIIAQQVVAGLDLETFQRSRILFYAATRCLEIISEAARRLPKAVRERHADLPWRKIMDAGIFYRHQYDNVAEDFVWNTIHQSLPPLLALVIAELDESAEP